MRNNQSGDNSMAKVKKREEYGDDSIEMLKGADRVRKKPSVIFGSDGLEGCEHAVFEILSNSIDEAREGFGNTITVTRFEDKSIEVQDYGRGIPVEFNRRENEYNWKLLFCELYAGGKYNTNDGGSYEYSLGTNGLGLCATQYASEYMEAEVHSNGYCYHLQFKNGEPVGLACAMKNAGVGVGLPDYGRCKLVIGDDGKVHIRAGASCIGQGLGTVLVQLVVTNAKLTRDQVVYDGNSTFITPDSGDTSGSRQTLVTGEACRRACLLLRDAMEYRSLSDLKGQEFYGEYYAKTNPLGANVPNPVSHVAYGYATQMCILDKETGKIKKMVAAHDVGKAINPLSCEGQIEGGVVMSMGYALTEQYPLDHGKPTAKYGTLGLFRSHQIPEIKAIVIDKPGLNLANGAIGIGEITSIPTAPAIAQAYYRYDGERRRSLPLDHTPYKK